MVCTHFFSSGPDYTRLYANKSFDYLEKYKTEHVSHYHYLQYYLDTNLGPIPINLILTDVAVCNLHRRSSVVAHHEHPSNQRWVHHTLENCQEQASSSCLDCRDRPTKFAADPVSFSHTHSMSNLLRHLFKGHPQLSHLTKIRANRQPVDLEISTNQSVSNPCTTRIWALLVVISTQQLLKPVLFGLGNGSCT